jgi:hypothetical protein
MSQACQKTLTSGAGKDGYWGAVPNANAFLAKHSCDLASANGSCRTGSLGARREPRFGKVHLAEASRLFSRQYSRQREAIWQRSARSRGHLVRFGGSENSYSVDGQSSPL